MTVEPDIVISTKSRTDKNGRSVTDMQHMNVEAAEQALGRAVVCGATTAKPAGSVTAPSGTVQPERAGGAALGLALGDAVAAWAETDAARTTRGRRARATSRIEAEGVDRVTALTQTMVLSTEADRAPDGRRAPCSATELVDRVAGSAVAR